jgi:hypothetical protein
MNLAPVDQTDLPLPLSAAESARRLRARRLTPVRRHRPDLGVRRRPLPRDPRQGRDPDPDLELLVRPLRGRREPPHRDRFRPDAGRRCARIRSFGDGPCWCAVRADSDRVRRARLPRRLGSQGVPRRAGPSAGSRSRRGWSPASRLREPIFTPATKEQEGHDVNITFEEMSQRIGADLAAELRALTLSLYAARRRARRPARDPHRRYQVRVRPERRARRLDRRGAHARLLPLLARRCRVPPRRQSPLLRQAIRPRLARVGPAGTRSPPAPELPAERGGEHEEESIVQAYRAADGRRDVSQKPETRSQKKRRS